MNCSRVLDRLLTVLIIVFVSGQCFGQGVGINATGAAPDASAALDVSATAQGMLVPRNDTTTVNGAAPTPADGLLIYQTTDSAFYYFDGVRWRNVSSGTAPAAAGDTYTTAGGSAAITSSGAWQVVPGLTQTITVPAGYQVSLSTTGVFTCAGGASTYSLLDLSFFQDGVLFRTAGHAGSYLRVGAENNAATNIPQQWHMSEVITVVPGTYTFDLRCVNAGGSPNNSSISGNGGSAFQGTLTIGLIKN